MCYCVCVSHSYSTVSACIYVRVSVSLCVCVCRACVSACESMCVYVSVCISICVRQCVCSLFNYKLCLVSESLLRHALFNAQLPRDCLPPYWFSELLTLVRVCSTFTTDRQTNKQTRQADGQTGNRERRLIHYTRNRNSITSLGVDG